MTDTLLVARQGPRLDLTMNRPGRRNALGLDEWRRLGDAVEARAVIGWGRYAELFGYDEEGDQFVLEEGQGK